MPQYFHSISDPQIAIDSNFLDHLLVTIANFGIAQSCEGMGGRLRCLADDLDAIAEGRAPDAEILVRAPTLSRWSFFGAPDGVHLMGVVEDHPHAGPGPILTSMIFAIDPSLTWARTLSRFYRLGDYARPPDRERPDMH
jgi:hypothetical protein